MVHFIASFEWPTLTEHLSLYGFSALALVLLALVALDMRRIVLATAVKSSSAHPSSLYRDGNGMSVFFAEAEDPSEWAALPAIAQKRRKRSAR
jgi:hypothetical protein